jgi:hypothetical protein
LYFRHHVESLCQQSADYFGAADIAPSRIFEINHCGFHVLVAEPSGDGTNAYTVLQMHGGKRVQKFVKIQPFANPVGHPFVVFEKLISRFPPRRVSGVFNWRREGNTPSDR